MIALGEKVKQIWLENAAVHNLGITISGLPTLASFSFNCDKSIEKDTFFTIEMLKQGFLGFRQFKPSYSHTLDDLEQYSKAVQKIFQLLSTESYLAALKTPNHHIGFQRLTKE